MLAAWFEGKKRCRADTASWKMWKWTGQKRGLETLVGNGNSQNRVFNWCALCPLCRYWEVLKNVKFRTLPLRGGEAGRSRLSLCYFLQHLEQFLDSQNMFCVWFRVSIVHIKHFLIKRSKVMSIVIKAMVRTTKWTARTEITLSFCL